MDLFRLDETDFNDFRRRALDGRLTESDWNRVKEYLPTYREEPLPLSDNLVRDKAKLGSKEAKKYIEYLLRQQYLQRNAEEELEITSQGIVFHDQLVKHLSTDVALKLRQLDEYLSMKNTGASDSHD